MLFVLFFMLFARFQILLCEPQRIRCKLLLLSRLYQPLTHADISGAVFTHAHFQKIAKISSLCNFHHVSEGIPSLLRFWLLMA